MNRIGCLNGLFVLSALSLVATDEGIEWSVATLWESRYVAEGRDELDEGGIVSTEVVAAWRGFEFGVWGALGDSKHYQQLDLTAAYGDEWLALAWLAGYTHLEFEPGSEDDDELFLELETSLPLELVVGVAGVYSFEAEGSFLEFGLSRTFSVFDERVSLSPYALYAFDFGYRTDAHDGPNHFQVGIECECAITERLALFAYAAHSFAEKDIEREGLDDVSWVGLGLSASF